MLKSRLKSRNLRVAFGAAAVGIAAFASTAAFGLPWDLDMTDAQSVKAYERLMQPLPDGVVAQPNVLTPKHFPMNYAPQSPEAAAAQNPFPDDEAHRAKGEEAYQTYCTPCHGDGVNLGPVAAKGKGWAVPVLAGQYGVLRNRSDGWVYSTIRNGSISTMMPRYGHALSEEEIWSVVRYVRTFEGSAYVMPAAPAAPQENAP
jgi:mono/diheme cytochrome c family protein